MPYLAAIPYQTLYRGALGFLEHRIEATSASRLNPYSFGEVLRMTMAAWLSSSTLFSAHSCLCHCV
jgi:hypothetical protein